MLVAYRDVRVHAKLRQGLACMPAREDGIVAYWRWLAEFHNNSLGLCNAVLVQAALWSMLAVNEAGCATI